MVPQGGLWGVPAGQSSELGSLPSLGVTEETPKCPFPQPRQ